jgi:Sec7-like guanine-nucleotide exchange factor
MSLRQVIWSSHSKNELTRTLRFWSNKNQSESYNKRLIRSIDRYLGFIQKNPAASRQVQPGINRIQILRFQLYYRYTDTTIEVLDFKDARSQQDLPHP